MNKSRFLITEDDTILNYYVLPLVGLRKGSFGTSFVRTFINREGTLVYVLAKNLSYQEDISKNSNFQDIMYLNCAPYYIFKIDTRFTPDIKLMLQGKYSKISNYSKSLIKHNSGLLYGHEVNRGGHKQVITSKPLYALDKSPVLIPYYQEKLKLTDQEVLDCIVTPDVELMNRFEEFDFIEYYLEEE